MRAEQEAPELTQRRRKSHTSQRKLFPGSSAEVRAAVPSWLIAGMAHYNFKKITVVPSAKVGDPKGPSVPAFLGQAAGRWGSGV